MAATEWAGPPSDPAAGADLAHVLEVAARGLLSRSGEVQHVLELIVSGAVESIPHVQRAGVSLLNRDRTLSFPAPSDGVVEELDALQGRLMEGPSYDSVFRERRTLISDLTVGGAARWPRFAPVAVEHGIATMCSLQLFARDRTAGALNLYADRPGVFDEDFLDTAAVFASHAAVALHGSQRVDHLNVALQSRDTIGQAKGILIERFSVSADTAFTMLVHTSQEANMKVREVAEWLVTETVRGRPQPAPDPAAATPTARSSTRGRSPD